MTRISRSGTPWPDCRTRRHTGKSSAPKLALVRNHIETGLPEPSRPAPDRFFGGADVIVTDVVQPIVLSADSQFGFVPRRRLVVTRHAAELSLLFYEFIERFSREISFSEAIRTAYQPVKVVLYGSYARGDQQASSDIDVAVIVDEIQGGFLDTVLRTGEVVYERLSDQGDP